jgi:hypothetical protein
LKHKWEIKVISSVETTTNVTKHTVKGQKVMTLICSCKIMKTSLGQQTEDIIKGRIFNASLLSVIRFMWDLHSQLCCYSINTDSAYILCCFHIFLAQLFTKRPSTVSHILSSHRNAQYLNNFYDENFKQQPPFLYY